MIAGIFSQSWVERLGWTLIHFLWQGVAIAGLYAPARRFLRGSRPVLRYKVGCVALTAMLAAPFVTWTALRPPVANLTGVSHPQVATAAVPTTVVLPASVRSVITTAPAPQFLPWVVLVWFLGCLTFSLRLAGGWMVARRGRSIMTRPAPREWQQKFAELAALIAIARPVRLLVSALVEVPTVAGWLRPVVLVPVGALAGLPAEQVEALLLHELAHIRRHDYLVNILQSVAEALLFYHPAVWWISRHVRSEREICCDDIAAAASGDVLVYARALVQLESSRPPRSGFALAANGASLSDRIARLLGQSGPVASSSGAHSLVAVALLLAAAAYGVYAQAGTRPAFAVASIKRSASPFDPEHEPVGAGYRPGGRFTATNMTLRLLIQFAYAPEHTAHSMPLAASRVVGGPAWIDREPFDIEAKPDHQTDVDRSWLMVQTLLADRFQLQLHRETRELPVWDLVVAKSGLKLPPPKDIPCVSFPPGTPPQQMRGKVDCGYVGVAPAGEGLRMRGNKVHISDLLRELSFALDRPVLDRTGFDGEFDLVLNFSPDDSLAGLPQGFGGPPIPALPNLFAALEQQLGLKLVPAKGPVEVLVVDGAERPTAN